jgi:hypothetical protein
VAGDDESLDGISAVFSPLRPAVPDELGVLVIGFIALAEKMGSSKSAASSTEPSEVADPCQIRIFSCSGFGKTWASTSG